MQVAPVEEDEICVIDSNQVLQECIKEQKKKAAKHHRKKSDKTEKVNKEESPEDAEGTEETEEQPKEESPADLEEDLDIPELEPEEDKVALAEQKAQAILEEAQEKAKKIIEDAEAKIEAMQFHAESEGHKEGYQQGYQESLQKQMAWEEESARQREALQQEYEEKQQSLEHDLVDVICQVVEKVFMIQFGDKKELILHGVDSVLTNVEGSHSFFIRVNEKNAEYLRENKDHIQAKVGQDVALDIVLDPVLDDTHCMIETDGGLFDCSMDVQMNNLIKDIKSLS
jgi:flagellar assembly protein FliH